MQRSDFDKSPDRHHLIRETRVIRGLKKSETLTARIYRFGF
jgi:hypothetical protein